MPLHPIDDGALLITLGIIYADATMRGDQVKKFSQICHLREFVTPGLSTPAKATLEARSFICLMRVVAILTSPWPSHTCITTGAPLAKPESTNGAALTSICTFRASTAASTSSLLHSNPLGSTALSPAPLIGRKSAHKEWAALHQHSRSTITQLTFPSYPISG